MILKYIKLTDLLTLIVKFCFDYSVINGFEKIFLIVYPYIHTFTKHTLKIYF